MTQTKLTLAGVLDAYKEILLKNPGKALKISADMFAVLSTEGSVHGVYTNLSGLPDLGSGFDFDISAFDTDSGAWDGESPEETRAFFESPTLVEFEQAHGFFVDWNGNARKTEAPGEGLKCDVDVARSHVDVVDQNGFVIHECVLFKTIEAMQAAGIDVQPVWTEFDSTRNCTPRPERNVK